MHQKLKETDGPMEAESHTFNWRSLTGPFATVLIVIGVMALITPQEREARLEGDLESPVWELKDLEGNVVRSSDFEGKAVALDFWATWCGPCIQEIPSFIELQKRYADAGFTVVGVALDDNQQVVQRFISRRDDINYPILFGDAKIQAAFGGVPFLPTTYLIGKDGKVAFKHVGLTPEATLEENIKELLATE